MRARLVAVLVVLALTGIAAAADQVVVEDWSRHPLGARGLPAGWQEQNWGSPAYDFIVVEDNGRRALHMKSKNEGSTITRTVKGLVDLKETPVLEWSWKAVALPRGGNSCKKATDDQAAQIYVIWERFPAAVRSRIVGYVWDTTAPVGTVCKSEKTTTVTYIVLRSGPADLGKWITERRNVADDFRKIYGDAADQPDGVSLSIDTNDTRSEAESFMGAMLFRKP